MDYKNISDRELIEQYIKESDSMSFYNCAEGESWYKERVAREACGVRRKEVISECKARGLELPVHNWMC